MTSGQWLVRLGPVMEDLIGVTEIGTLAANLADAMGDAASFGVISIIGARAVV